MSGASEHDGGEVVLYQSPDGEVCLDVRLEHESIWLTQKQMAELFDTSTDNVGRAFLSLETFEKPGDLYLARGDDVDPLRPLFAGDVVADVAIPASGTEAWRSS